MTNPSSTTGIGASSFDDCMTELSCSSHHDIGKAFIRWRFSTSTRNPMRRVQSPRCVAIRASTIRAVMSALKMRLRRCKGETLSLAAGLVAIAIGSLAFWLNQPAHLFNGGVSSSASATAPPRNRTSSPFTHGLLSLELRSAMQRASPGPTPRRAIAANERCELNGSAIASPASHDVQTYRACTHRANAH